MTITGPVTQSTDRAGAPPAPRASRQGRHRVVGMVAGSVLILLAVVFLGGGGWALWQDRVSRDANGFVPIGSTTLRTPMYAIVGKLHGSGPSWLWESHVWGRSRVRAASQAPGPLFIGIARTSDLFRYLRGAGYATIDRFEVTARTTHAGGPPSGPPSIQSIWAASTHGSGKQTLQWDSRAGDWSILFMNDDARAGVGVHGDAGAKLPVLPWIAAGLLLAGAAAGVCGGWLFVRAVRREETPVTATPDRPDDEETTPSPLPASSRAG